MHRSTLTIAFIGLGSNVGNRAEFLHKARLKIEEVDIYIVQESRIYESAAWGYENQANFLNQVIKIETPLNAESLLKRLQSIELELGRQRRPHWQEREIDLDILFFGQSIIHSNRLWVPHRYWKERKFVLIPLTEIAADFLDPETGKTPLQVMSETSDTSEVYVYKSAL